MKKKPEAYLELKSFNKQNRLYIQITDDGQGIDIDKVKQKAINKGLISEDEELDDKKIINLIFLPNFSTKDKANQLGGRGIGMNIISDAIKKLNGEITIQTEKGKGTTFLISLPSSMEVISALIIKTCGERYAIPLSSIAEIITINHDQVKTVKNKRVLMLRDSIIPLVFFEDFFKNSCALFLNTSNFS